jgi:hypothetical protein
MPVYVDDLEYPAMAPDPIRDSPQSAEALNDQALSVR